jgi:NAD(P)-dependent dehydrogenase (short-subunit alcohol dehydrogenase family)
MSKVILITGTSSGFGRLTATTLAADGHCVVAAMRDSKGRNAVAAQDLSQVDNLEVVDMDVTSDQSVKNAVDNVVKRYGKIDVLVNNAAITGFGVAEAHSLDTYRAMFETNFYGVLRTYFAVLPVMRAAKCGLIINLSTGASGFSLPYMVPYLASKFAMETMVEGIDSELRDFGVESVSVPCGVYPTGMADKGGYSADKPEITAAYPDAGKRMTGLATALFGKMKEFNMDPQTIADGIKKLVDMQKGSRPLRYPLDAIAEGTDEEFISARAKIKRKWAAKYGFDI